MSRLATRLDLLRPHSLRDAMAMLVVAIYLVTGLLHGVCDLDVTNISGKAVISSADTNTGHTDKGAVADHHCHGCFSVSVPAPMVAVVDRMPTPEVMAMVQILASGLSSGIDPPPPKFLI